MARWLKIFFLLIKITKKMSHSLHKNLYLFILYLQMMFAVLFYIPIAPNPYSSGIISPLLPMLRIKPLIFSPFYFQFGILGIVKKNDYEGIFINPEPVYIYFSLMKIEKHVFERNIP